MKSAIKNAADAGKLSIQAAQRISAENGCSLKEVEIQALREGIWPLRYERQSGIMTPEEQIMLLESTVAVAGCGALGGHVVEMLARLGVGTLLIVDPDRFDETNLNRQPFCHMDTIGKYKADVACMEISKINPAVSARALVSRIEDEEGAIVRVAAVMDCLDNVSSRLLLASSCRQMGIPLIHGAVSGTCGEIAVELPKGKTVMEQLYPNSPSRFRREHVLSFSAGAIAALQCAEAWKILTCRGSSLAGRWTFFDIAGFSFETADNH